MTGIDHTLAALRKRSRIAAIISALGAVVVFGSLATGSVLIGRGIADKQRLDAELESALQAKRAAITTVTTQHAQLSATHAAMARDVALLEAQKRAATDRATELVDQVQAAAEADDCRALARSIEADQTTGAPGKERAREVWRQGYAAYLRRNEPLAIQRYREAIAIDPTYGPPYNSLGRITLDNAMRTRCMDRGGIEEAAAYLQKAFTAWPTYTVAKQNLATLELLRGNGSEAARLAREILAVQPNNSKATRIIEQSAQPRARPYCE